VTAKPGSPHKGSLKQWGPSLFGFFVFVRGSDFVRGKEKKKKKKKKGGGGNEKVCAGLGVQGQIGKQIHAGEPESPDSVSRKNGQFANHRPSNKQKKKKNE
jgi:hypothetical protein